jgi:hypothetical protein
MDDHDLAWRISGYLALPAFIILVGYVFLIGLMYLVRPRQWARSLLSLYPPQLLNDLEYPGRVFGMRILGFVLVLFCLTIVLALFGVDTTAPEQIGYAIVSLYVLYWAVAVLFGGGLYMLFLPRRSDGPLGLALTNRIRNSLALQIVVRVFGLACCWLAWRIVAGLLSSAPTP